MNVLPFWRGPVNAYRANASAWEELVAYVEDAFYARRQDTAAISRALSTPEATIDAALAVARERRRAIRIAEARPIPEPSGVVGA